MLKGLLGIVAGTIFILNSAIAGNYGYGYSPNRILSLEDIKVEIIEAPPEAANQGLIDVCQNDGITGCMLLVDMNAPSAGAVVMPDLSGNGHDFEANGFAPDAVFWGNLTDFYVTANGIDENFKLTDTSATHSGGSFDYTDAIGERGYTIIFRARDMRKTTGERRLGIMGRASVGQIFINEPHDNGANRGAGTWTLLQGPQKRASSGNDSLFTTSVDPPDPQWRTIAIRVGNNGLGPDGDAAVSFYEDKDDNQTMTIVTFSTTEPGYDADFTADTTARDVFLLAQATGALEFRSAMGPIFVFEGMKSIAEMNLVAVELEAVLPN